MCAVRRISRAGFTLVELCYCLAMMAIVLFTMGSLELTLRKTDAHYAKDISNRAPKDVLALLLSDIHRATAAQVPDETQLRLTCGPEDVLWTSKGGRITRAAGGHQWTWKTGDSLAFTPAHPSGACIQMTFQKAGWSFIGCRPQGNG